MVIDQGRTFNKLLGGGGGGGGGGSNDLVLYTTSGSRTGFILGRLNQFQLSWEP
jgi:hypothetical protein